MKKKLTVLLMAVLCMTLLTGCFCQHEWKDATCQSPKTCAKCEKTEGELGGHVYADATCDAPKTCTLCGAVEGEALGHDWVDATCYEAKYCARCAVVEGEPLGHSWADATTDAPKTCLTCLLTEGEPIVTDPRFHSSEVASLLGKWGMELVADGEMMGLEGFTGEVELLYIFEFGNAGDYSVTMEILNKDAFNEALIDYTITSTYAEFANQGLDQGGANEAMQSAYGMSVEDYARQTISQIDFGELFNTIYSAIDAGGVYYAEGPYLISGPTWDSEMTYTMFGFDVDGNLYLDEICYELGLDACFTRIIDTPAEESAEEDQPEVVETLPADETQAVEETTAETQVPEETDAA